VGVFYQRVFVVEVEAVVEGISVGKGDNDQNQQ